MKKAKNREQQKGTLYRLCPPLRDNCLLPQTLLSSDFPCGLILISITFLAQNSTYQVHVTTSVPKWTECNIVYNGRKCANTMCLPEFEQ